MQPVYSPGVFTKRLVDVGDSDDKGVIGVGTTLVKSKSALHAMERDTY